MLGWWISIYKQKDFGLDKADRNEHRLATWESAVNGIRWLEELVNNGQAEKSGDGYPYRYKAIASDILNVIVSGPPKHEGSLVIGDDYVLPGSWTGNIEFNDKNIAECAPDEPLIIMVWDLS
ncbi:MAG: hypothetical protein WBP13_11840 [Methylophilaceae bacterium]